MIGGAAPGFAETTCASPPFDAPEGIADIAARLATTIAGFSGLEASLAQSVERICVTDDLLVARGYFEPETGRIVLAEGLPDGLLLAVLVHELRHAEQFSQGLCPTLALGMKDYAQAVFAMEADASVTSLVVAARLRDSGDSAMWDALATWPMQADIATRFEATLAETGQLGRAAQDAFDAWFDRQTRTQAYYVASCLDYLDQIEREHLLPRYDAIAPDYLARLCQLPDGADYNCILPDTP